MRNHSINLLSLGKSCIDFFKELPPKVLVRLVGTKLGVLVETLEMALGTRVEPLDDTREAFGAVRGDGVVINGGIFSRFLILVFGSHINKSFTSPTLELKASIFAFVNTIRISASN